MNSFPLRRAPSRTHPLSSLAPLVGASHPRGDLEISGVAPLVAATSQELGFVAHRRYVGGLDESAAGALLVARSLENLLGEDSRPRLVVEDPHRALATLLDLFRPVEPGEAEIHPTAVLGRGVRLGRKVRIAPYAVIEDGAEVGDGSSIGAHVVVGAGVKIGANTFLHPHVVVYPGVVLGNRVILHAGVRIGVDGFGYVAGEGKIEKVPQIGACIVEDDVEIGANSTVDRGSIGETRVMMGSKLDNLVHLGHNVVVGRMALLAAQVGVAGSSRIGSGVLAGGQAGIAGHLTVGDGAQLAAQAGIIGDVEAGETVMGFPARPRAEFLRTSAAQSRLPKALSRLRELEARVADLGSGSEKDGAPSS